MLLTGKEKAGYSETDVAIAAAEAVQTRIRNYDRHRILCTSCIVQKIIERFSLSLFQVF